MVAVPCLVTDSFVNSQEWTLGRSVPHLRLVCTRCTSFLSLCLSESVCTYVCLCACLLWLAVVYGAADIRRVYQTQLHWRTSGWNSGHTQGLHEES